MRTDAFVQNIPACVGQDEITDYCAFVGTSPACAIDVPANSVGFLIE